MTRQLTRRPADPAATLPAGPQHLTAETPAAMTGLLLHLSRTGRLATASAMHTLPHGGVRVQATLLPIRTVPARTGRRPRFYVGIAAAIVTVLAALAGAGYMLSRNPATVVVVAVAAIAVIATLKGRSRGHCHDVTVQVRCRR